MCIIFLVHLHNEFLLAILARCHAFIAAPGMSLLKRMQKLSIILDLYVLLETTFCESRLIDKVFIMDC